MTYGTRNTLARSPRTDLQWYARQGDYVSMDEDSYLRPPVRNSQIAALFQNAFQNPRRAQTCSLRWLGSVGIWFQGLSALMEVV